MNGSSFLDISLELVLESSALTDVSPGNGGQKHPCCALSLEVSWRQKDNQRYALLLTLFKILMFLSIVDFCVHFYLKILQQILFIFITGLFGAS